MFGLFFSPVVHFALDHVRLDPVAALEQNLHRDLGQ